jgi:hypothetical protein
MKHFNFVCRQIFQGTATFPEERLIFQGEHPVLRGKVSSPRGAAGFKQEEHFQGNNPFSKGENSFQKGNYSSDENSQFSNHKVLLGEVKTSKAIGLLGCQMLRIAHCLTNRLTDGGQAVGLMHRRR